MHAIEQYTAWHRYTNLAPHVPDSVLNTANNVNPIRSGLTIQRLRSSGRKCHSKTKIYTTRVLGPALKQKTETRIRRYKFSAEICPRLLCTSATVQTRENNSRKNMAPPQQNAQNRKRPLFSQVRRVVLLLFCCSPKKRTNLTEATTRHKKPPLPAPNPTIEIHL